MAARRNLGITPHVSDAGSLPCRLQLYRPGQPRSNLLIFFFVLYLALVLPQHIPVNQISTASSLPTQPAACRHSLPHYASHGARTRHFAITLTAHAITATATSTRHPPTQYRQDDENMVYGTQQDFAALSAALAQAVVRLTSPAEEEAAGR